MQDHVLFYLLFYLFLVFLFTSSCILFVVFQVGNVLVNHFLLLGPSVTKALIQTMVVEMGSILGSSLLPLLGMPALLLGSGRSGSGRKGVRSVLVLMLMRNVMQVVAIAILVFGCRFRRRICGALVVRQIDIDGFPQALLNASKGSKTRIDEKSGRIQVTGTAKMPDSSNGR